MAAVTAIYTVASPKVATVVNVQGRHVGRADWSNYPLTASCVHCGRHIVAQAGDAEWYHADRGQARCRP
jgi:hypothetical protein